MFSRFSACISKGLRTAGKPHVQNPAVGTYTNVVPKRYHWDIAEKHRKIGTFAVHPTFIT
jgi:hypothetical protein